MKPEKDVEAAEEKFEAMRVWIHKVKGKSYLHSTDVQGEAQELR